MFGDESNSMWIKLTETLLVLRLIGPHGRNIDTPEEMELNSLR